MSDPIRRDVAIVGAGPTGLFAVFELGMLKMSACVIDALDAVGGQCAALYPEKPIYDIPGRPSVMAQDLIDDLEAQAAPFSPEMLLGRRVETATRVDGGWRLGTDKGDVIEAKAIIIAAGAGAFGPNRPPLEGIETFEGDPDPARGVKYLVRRREDFRDRRVVIAGGGDSAVDWALSLPDVGAEVKVVHRRDKFRAAPESVDRMRALAAEGRIEIVAPYQLHGLDGADGRLDAVIVATLQGETRRLDCDVLLPFYGLSTDLGPIADWGLELHQHRLSVEPTTAATSEAGIFAIGDVATYDHKMKLILTGFSEAAFAAHAIREIVYPGEALHFEYSTSKGLPGAA